MKGLINTILTDKERAAIYMHVFGGVDDWQQLYLIALPQPYTGKPRTLLDYSSRWKNSPKIKEFVQQLQGKRFAMLDEAKRAGFNEGLSKAGENVHTKRDDNETGRNLVDYSNPAEQARKLNELVNTATDTGEALDALKVIIQTQRADREAAREQKTNRVYLPVNCCDCPLYSAAKGAKR